MDTTVLIENAILFVATGYALVAHKKRVYLLFIIAIFSHMLLDNILKNTLDVYDQGYGRMDYYMYFVGFYLIMFSMFMSKNNGLYRLFAGIMIFKSFLSMAMALNGAELKGVTLPHSVIIGDMHELFNSAVWVVELFAVLSVEVSKVWNTITTKPT